MKPGMSQQFSLPFLLSQLSIMEDFFPKETPLGTYQAVFIIVPVVSTPVLVCYLLLIMQCHRLVCQTEKRSIRPQSSDPKSKGHD